MSKQKQNSKRVNTSDEYYARLKERKNALDEQIRVVEEKRKSRADKINREFGSDVLRVCGKALGYDEDHMPDETERKRLLAFLCIQAGGTNYLGKALRGEDSRLPAELQNDGPVPIDDAVYTEEDPNTV